MDGLWHYDDAGRETGPLPAAHLRTLVLGGAIGADTPVRREGEETWVALRESALAPLLREPDAAVGAGTLPGAGVERMGVAGAGGAVLDAAGDVPPAVPVRTFGEAVRSCLRRYATFEGRAGRPEYWWFFVFSLLVYFALGVIDIAVLGAGPGDFGVLGLLGQLALFLPSLAVMVRRLHDGDRSGWMALLGLIPLLGFVVLMVLMALPGTAGPNRFGAGAAGPVR